MRILVVCTANVCRSPVAERLLRRHLANRGVAATVTSAGVRGGRLGVHPDTVRAAREVDLDLGDHVSRRLEPELIATEGADLVVGMTREHLREIVTADPAAFTRTFTLRELARRSLDVPLGTTGLDAWVAAASADRRAADLLVPSESDDLPDPYGGPARGHVAMVREVDHLTARVADELARATTDPG